MPGEHTTAKSPRIQPRHTAPLIALNKLLCSMFNASEFQTLEWEKGVYYAQIPGQGIQLLLMPICPNI